MIVLAFWIGFFTGAICARLMFRRWFRRLANADQAEAWEKSK
jgi:hypothetical protein